MNPWFVIRSGGSLIASELLSSHTWSPFSTCGPKLYDSHFISKKHSISHFSADVTSREVITWFVNALLATGLTKLLSCRFLWSCKQTQQKLCDWMASQPGFILLSNFLNSVNKPLAAQIHSCECYVKLFLLRYNPFGFDSWLGHLHGL